MIQLERGYLLQNSVNKIPLVWKRFVIHLSFILFRFRLWRLSFITLFISSHQPLFPFSRRVHRGHLFLQSKTRKYVLWGNFMKHKIFSRDILTFQLSLRRTVVVYKRTLFLTIHCRQNVLTQLWLLKWFSVYYKKKPLKCDLTIQYFSWLFHTVLTISAVSAWKKQRWKMVVNVKEKYEISRNSKYDDTFIPSRQEQLSFKTDFPHLICCVSFFEP